MMSFIVPEKPGRVLSEKKFFQPFGEVVEGVLRTEDGNEG